MKSKVLVTGGAGYIGSHTSKALAQSGFVPVVYDNLSLGSARFVKWGELIEGDTRDADRLARVLTEERIDAVIHFAAVSSVGESVIEPSLYYENNVGGLLGLLRGMREANCRKIVFSSTAAVYGPGDGAPLAENADKHPMNPYGFSKWVCENVLKDYAAAYDFRTISLRYFNASGADPDGEAGEFRDKETHLIPRAMMALLGHINDFRVLGSDYETPDGTAVRDYIHVSDLAEAHVLAVQRLLNGGGSGTFNVGTGRGISVGDVLAEISAVTGRQMAVEIGTRRAGDPAILVANPARISRELGFRPKLSSLREIIATAWNWHQKAHPQTTPADEGRS